MRFLLLSALTLSISACGVPSESYELNGGSNALKLTISKGQATGEKVVIGGKSFPASGPTIVHVDTKQAAFSAQTNIKTSPNNRPQET